MGNNYNPIPIDIASVSVSTEIHDLIERLAENAHEVWAAHRIADGWTRGEKRCDDSKTHPCLVPFGELPESERKYDREMVQQTIKAVVALGYTIKRIE
jgi:hypothetical protein